MKNPKAAFPDVFLRGLRLNYINNSLFEQKLTYLKLSSYYLPVPKVMPRLEG